MGTVKMWMLAVVLSLLTIQVFSLHENLQKCVETFKSKIDNYAQIKSLLEEGLKSTSPIDISSAGKIIVDASLFSHHSVLYHMIQLNISSVTHSVAAANCQATRRKNALKLSPGQPLYVKHGLFDWLVVLDTYSDSLVLLNEVPVKKIEYHRKTSNIVVDWLANLSSKEISNILADYRDLVTCAVPLRQRYLFNLHLTTSQKYWTELVDFLKIKTISDYNMKRLIDGGVNATLKNSETCSSKSKACIPSQVVSPNICANDVTLIPESMYYKFGECATKYANDIATIFGDKFRSFVLEQLNASPIPIRSAPIDSDRIIINAGPSNTGADAMYLAMTQLNITARHSQSYSSKCGRTEPLPIDSEMKILTDKRFKGPVYWSDDPTPAKWWHILKMYPMTRIMMTDVRNESAWLIRTKEEHNAAIIQGNVTSTTLAPLPFEVASGVSRLSDEFIESLRLTKISSQNASLAFAAYRSLIKCAVPESQLFWTFLLDPLTPLKFWNDVINFVKVEVSDSMQKKLIAAGLPKYSSSDCSVASKSAKSCISWHTPLTPSVCQE